MIDEEGEKVSLVWVPGHKSITGNEMADIEAKPAPIWDVSTTRPQDNGSPLFSEKKFPIYSILTHYDLKADPGHIQKSTVHEQWTYSDVPNHSYWLKKIK
jgi:hypothetical protein